MKKNLLHNGKGRYVVGCFARRPTAPMEPIRKRRRDGKRERETEREREREREREAPPGLSGFAISSSSFAAGNELREEEEEEGGVFRRFFDRGEETRSVTFISRHISPFDELISLTTSCL